MEDSHILNAVSKQDLSSGKFSEYVRQHKRKGLKGNRNKRKGTAFEYRVATYYRRRGFIVLRARGSLGPADLICLKEGERDIFVQCKDINSNYFDRHEMQHFSEFCKRYNKRCVWAYNYHKPSKKRGRMKFLNLETTPLWKINKEYIAN